MIEEMMQDVAAPAQTQSRGLQPHPDDIWNMSLPQLIKRQNELLEMGQDEAAMFSQDDVWGLVSACRELVAGKIDNIATLCKNVLPAHKEAIKKAASAQLDRLEKMDQKLKALVIEALELNHATRMDGTLWSARVQSSPSVEITDPAVVPTQFHETTLVIKTVFPSSDKAKTEFWTKFLEQFEEDDSVKTTITFGIPKTPLRSLLKTQTIPGVRLVKNPHVRFEAGKITPEPLPEMPFLME